jgi:hypothetical protein
MIVYVVTCGQCGQTWQRTGVIEGQATECIFCGRLGRLCIGAMPGPTSPTIGRVEAWLLD